MKTKKEIDHLVLTREQIYLCDQDVMAREKITSEQLLERAASAAYRVFLQNYTDSFDMILVLAGPGHNGADAWVFLRHWLQNHLHIQAIVVEPTAISPQSMVESKKKDVQIKFPEVTYLKVEQASTESHIENKMQKTLRGGRKILVIDGVFGIGLNKPVDDFWQVIFKKINSLKQLHPALITLCAIDLPSGLDANSGELKSVVLNCDMTLTMGALKNGLLTLDGPKVCGTTHVVDIGYSNTFVKQLLQTTN